MSVRNGFDDTFPRPRATGYSGVVQRRVSRFAVWAWSPIISFQVGLTGGYIALAWFGVASLISAPPSFEYTTPEGYSWFWAIVLTLGAVIATLGSVSRLRMFENIERIGSSMVSVAVGSYTAIVTWIAFVAGDPSRIAGSAGFLALSVPLIVRTMWLWSHLFRK